MTIRDGRRIPNPAAIVLLAWMVIAGSLLVGWVALGVALS